MFGMEEWMYVSEELCVKLSFIAYFSFFYTDSYSFHSCCLLVPQLFPLRSIAVERKENNCGTNKEKQIKEELLLSQPERFFWEYSFKGARGYFTLIYCTGEGITSRNP